MLVYYVAMNHEIYLNEYFKGMQRSVAIFVDGPNVHKVGDRCKESNQLFVQQFSYIKLFYFHANITAIVQPMDQGTILSFKFAYRLLLSLSLVKKARIIMDKDN